MAVNSKSTFYSKFGFGDKVNIDGGDVVMTVTGFLFTRLGGQVQCSWFANGTHYETWFYEWRLSWSEK